MAPPSQFPFDYHTTSSANVANGYRGYMALPENPTCGLRKVVCIPFCETYAGQFTFQTISTLVGPSGFYNGDTAGGTLPAVQVLPYINGEQFVVSPLGQPDQPYLANFPTTATGSNPHLQFTRPAGPVPEMPGVSVPPEIPFPLYFNVWQQWPTEDPAFPSCKVGYFRLSGVNSQLRIGCNLTATLVLTPAGFNFQSGVGPVPDPNIDPRWIFANAIAPVYIVLQTACFTLPCAEKDCRAKAAAFPFCYFSGFVADEPNTVSCTPVLSICVPDACPLGCCISPSNPTIRHGSQTFTVTPNGGSGVYTYLWSTGATTRSITATATGTYTATVTDSDGSTSTCSATLTINH
jgi:hypothetical protein